MATPRQALALLQAAADDGRLNEVCERHAVAVLGAFGSATHSGVDSPRDLDVAVGWRPGSGRDLLALWDDLSVLSGAGDALDLLATSPCARATGPATSRCVPLYEAQPQLLARRQIAALLEVMDTAWLRRVELDRLAAR